MQHHFQSVNMFFVFFAHDFQNGLHDFRCLCKQVKIMFG